MPDIQFHSPWVLLALMLIPLLIVGRWFYSQRSVEKITLPTVQAFESDTSSLLNYVKPFLFILRLLALVLIILGLARPQTVDISTQVQSDEGVDILMVVDVSLSMLAEDLKPTRLDALQEVAEAFVTERKSDRIGMVEYSGEAVTKVPLTTDRSVLVKAIQNVKTDQLKAGTAIGIGLATAVNHFENSKAKSKVVLLITDGGESAVDFSSDRIYISPEDAAKIAADKGIKVYTIGIGTTGFIPLPRGYEHYPQHLFKLDENLLRYIADKANGKYFRATDNESLKKIYDDINDLEKSEINEVKYYHYTEYYRYFLGWALAILLLEIILRSFVFKQLA